MKPNWELAFEEFNELEMCGNIKERERFVKAKDGNNPGIEIFWLVLVFWPYLFTPIFDWLDSCGTEIGLEDLKLCSLPKF